MVNVQYYYSLPVRSKDISTKTHCLFGAKTYQPRLIACSEQRHINQDPLPVRSKDISTKTHCLFGAKTYQPRLITCSEQKHIKFDNPYRDIPDILSEKIG
ncbi:hypothetical protein DPMN_068044 [Dreissena polymorpha]|uniref:Uncharacterized protein n=1 Tax=Dreissena polymorpha TaxID=45954 RepID=A0A9D4BTW9_DREPO|nr:hypothetical protein DPMN_068044 [Dreissena polymorpha]